MAARKKGRKLNLEIAPFDALERSAKDCIDKEAELMARLRQVDKHA
jgi:hypothetical protein